jgi:oligopeptidase A
LPPWARTARSTRRSARSIRALDPLGARARELALRDFELPAWRSMGRTRADFAENQVEQGRLSTEYANAVMDATEAWSLHVTDPARLAGVPEADLAGMAAAAQAKGHEAGWLITLHAPVVAVLTYAQDRALRQEVQHAYATRIGPGAECGQFDNGPRMAALLALARGGGPAGATMPPACRSPPRWRKARRRWKHS